MPYAQLSQVRLEYIVHGEGPERVVFLHGFQASARIWRAVQAALPADRYTSLAIHHRGAGGSEAPADEAAYSIPIFAADAFELTESLGWRDFTLVGHSLGGATAVRFAVDHPDLLKGLVLLDPADPDGREVPGGEAGVAAIIERMIAGRREQLAGGPSLEGIGAAGAAGEVARMLIEDMRAAPEARLRGSMRSMLTIRTGEAVGRLPMPVLMAMGDADEVIPVPAMLRTWAKLPQGSGLHVWHGVGHSPNVDCPQEVAALIRRFVEVTVPARANR